MDLEARPVPRSPSRYLVRELDRNPSETPPLRCAVVGAGRLGHALAAALADAGITVEGPLGRGADPAADVVLLTVPDGEIAAAAGALTPHRAQFVGHCSGATTLAPLRGHEAFSLHPLMTVPEGGAAPFAGAGCAVAGSTGAAVRVAEGLASALGMRPVEVADEDRAAYHAAASIAANFLVALEGQAERLAATAGVPRELLVPLARAALENWAANGAEHALTGPVARGDEATIARQRAAIAERAPDLLETFDALVAASRVLAA
jgi:predicted short-subunit dehydrogenase-like oxidoreductase (DUF2520 family)